MKFLYFICFFSLLVFIHGEDDLLAVTMMYRHGDRTPLIFYENDPYKDPSLWPTMPGELTNVGKEQHFKLGKWLRKRYDVFLSRFYNKSEIYVRSSDLDRCMMSAASNLAGMFPPEGKDVWNLNLLWQPIPIHTIPIEEDDIAEVIRTCTAYNRLLDEAKKYNYFKQLDEKYKSLYEFLTEKSGTNVTNVEDVHDLYDILYIESIYNFTLPDWTHEVLPQLIEIGDLAHKLFSFTSQLSRLFIGRYFDNVRLQFEFFTDKFNANTIEKFRVFSAHDIQVYGVLNALNVDNLKMVPYAAVVIFELRKTQQGMVYLQVVYKTKDDEADIVKIGDCEEKCEIGRFMELLKPLVLSQDEYRNECS